jgi:hypothetical protein
MRDEDEIIRAHEAEFQDSADPAHRSNRGFWLVTGAIGVACVFLLVEIFVNGPIKDTIAHAEATLRAAQTAADSVRTSAGSHTEADASAMAAVDDAHTYRPGDSASTGLDDVSIATRAGEWAAAVEARPEACFYLRLTDTGEVFYGVGTVCTGETALRATDPRW